MHDTATVPVAAPVTAPIAAAASAPAPVPAGGHAAPDRIDDSAMPRLDGRFAVLLRGGNLQVGTAPDRAVMIRPPHGVAAAQLADVLRRLDGAHRLDGAVRSAHLTIDRVRPVLDELVRAGLLHTGGPRTATRSVTLVGAGPLTDKLREHLPGQGVRVRGAAGADRTVDPSRIASASPAPVLLADHTVVEPRVHRMLHELALPHLHVHLRDGVGIVGPLVVPGRTACLRCDDLHLSDRDPAWPELIAQQLGHCGRSDPATVLAAACLAAARMRSYLYAGAAGLDTQVEIDVHAPAMRTVPRRPHPACTCRRARAMRWHVAHRDVESGPDRRES